MSPNLAAWARAAACGPARGSSRRRPESSSTRLPPAGHSNLMSSAGLRSSRLPRRTGALSVRPTRRSVSLAPAHPSPGSCSRESVTASAINHPARVGSLQSQVCLSYPSNMRFQSFQTADKFGIQQVAHCLFFVAKRYLDRYGSATLF